MHNDEREPEPTSFVELHWNGQRFENHEFPIASARELSIYEEALKNLAREIWIKMHPSRSRVPRGFSDSFSLYLSEIKPGCVNTVVKDRRSHPEQMAFNDTDAFSKARETSLKLFEGSLAPEDVAEFRALGEMLKFGSTLKEDESVALIDGSTGKRVEMTHNSRSNIRKKYGVEEEEIQLTFLATLSRLDDGGNLTLRTLDGQSITASAIDPDRWAKFSSDFKLRKHARPVLIQAIVVVDNDQKLRRITHLEHMEWAFPIDWTNRLCMLMDLETGWLGDDEGTPVSLPAKELADKLLYGISETGWLEDGRRPGIYPLPDGGLQFEWTQEKTDYYIEISNDRKISIGLVAENRYEDMDVPSTIDDQASFALEKLDEWRAEL